ncbi:DoxX family membrane protein [Prescottella sp. R16]|uniref:DoxX family membrane protein n=1 Tax=Prescottella sp. R16 TaxID=3064529 RepID=UPI00272DF7E4|nr:DoxX family membrane protein [Prescottella sp. R16]
MTDKPSDTPGTGSAPSPYDQPTGRFPVVSNPAGRPLAHTDEDLDFGALDGLPTEQIPTYRPAASPIPAPQPAGDDLPTAVIDRTEPATEAFAEQASATEPIRAAAPVPPEQFTPTTAAPVVVPPAAPAAEVGRGTLDVGLLILRLAVGGTLLAHGLQKLTGWWNGPGLLGYRDDLAAAGFDQARILAVAGGVGEVAGGLLLILGLITPVAAAAVLAVMINAWCLKQSAVPGLEYFAPDGIEYETVLAAGAAAIALTGPGRIALDGRRSWATRPRAGSVLILLAGIAAGLAVWFVLNGANPVI